jgi:hypothetical protein
VKTALIVGCLAVSFVFSSGATAHPCPAGTTLKRVPTSPEVRSQPYFPVSEELCVRNAGRKTEVRHGRYVLWGPNGEIQQEGSFVDGKKDGEWIYRLPSQTVVRTWKQDRFVDARVISSPSVFVIDFAACVPQTFGIPAGLGSTLYAVTGRKHAKCLMEYSIEIEMGVGPRNRCAVPVALGKVTISNTDMGLDFSPIAKYCVSGK